MTFTVHHVPGAGAEDVVVTPDGSVFTGTEDGAILRVSPDGGRIDRIAQTGGRPLGLELFDNGDLLVCDADAGLLVVHVADGSIETLLTEIDGVRMRFCNNAAIAGDGTIWFSDSSLHYGIHQWKDDFVQHTRTGRLVRRDVDGTVTVVIDDLAFANGVALSSDEQFVAVAETGRPHRGPLVDRRAPHGRAGLPGPRPARLPRQHRAGERRPDLGDHRVAEGPARRAAADGARCALRKLVTRIPETLQPKPKRTIRVQAYDDAGTLVHDIDLQEPGFHMVTGVREHAGRVWMGSLHEPAVAVHDLS